MSTAITAATAVPAHAAGAMQTYRVSADRVAFYTNRFELEGEGNVRVDTGIGYTLSADAFSMDVRSSRFVVAGNVRLRGPHLDESFVALSADFVAGRAYGIVDGAPPDRLAFTGNDFAHPQHGAQAPADTFALPLITDPATKLGAKITIGTRNYLRYGSCRTQVIGGFGLYLPLPDCYVNVGDDPNLPQSALSGANLGGALKLTGNANAVSSLIFNYDSVNGIYAALQQNVSSPDAWAALALTASRYPGASLVAAATPGDAFGVRLSSQFQSLATSSTNDITSYRYTDVRLAQPLPFGYVELFASNGTESGTGASYVPSRPFSIQADLASPNVALGTDAFLVMRAGYGEQRNTYGVQQLGAATYTTLGFGYVNAALSAPAIALGGTDPRRRFDLGLLASESLQSYSIPHETSITTTGASLAKALGGATLSLAYTIANVADRYAQSQLVYPVGTFDGLATFHTVALAGAFEASSQLTASITVRGHADSVPAGSPLFPSVGAAQLGQNPYPYQLGEPPFDVTVAARLRLNPQLSIDITDTKFINPRGWPSNDFQFLVRP